MNVTGKITAILKAESGVSKAGKEWSKQSFLVETDEKYNNLYCFELFNKTVENKKGDTVKVEFNVNTNEWNGKYFTSLGAWKVETIDSAKRTDTITPNQDDLPSF